MFERNNAGLEQLMDVAKELLAFFRDDRIFAFYGNLGAGKTTFIQDICKALQSPDTVNSPTFAIINEYTTPASGPLYHFDFYRINELEEVYDLGYEDYFYGGHYCFIEWPEKIAPLLPERHIEVSIVPVGDFTRRITARQIGI